MDGLPPAVAGRAGGVLGAADVDEPSAACVREEPLHARGRHELVPERRAAAGEQRQVVVRHERGTVAPERTAYVAELQILVKCLIDGVTPVERKAGPNAHDERADADGGGSQHEDAEARQTEHPNSEENRGGIQHDAFLLVDVRSPLIATCADRARRIFFRFPGTRQFHHASQDAADDQHEERSPDAFVDHSASLPPYRSGRGSVSFKPRSARSMNSA